MVAHVVTICNVAVKMNMGRVVAGFTNSGEGTGDGWLLRPA